MPFGDTKIVYPPTYYKIQQDKDYTYSSNSLTLCSS